jgi:hypothetical protein
MFFFYGEVTIVSEGLQNLGLWSWLMAFEEEETAEQTASDAEWFVLHPLLICCFQSGFENRLSSIPNFDLCDLSAEEFYSS